MRKEILLAIIVGILVGLGITFGLYLLRQQFGDTSTVDTIEQSRLSDTLPTETDELQGSLTIQQPTPDTYTIESSIRVVGRSIPQSYIVAFVGANEFITTADSDGDFSMTVTLAPGGNRVTIVATTPDGTQETVVRSVVYSEIDLNAPVSTESASATPSATPRATAAPRATATPRPTAAPTGGN